MKVFEKVITVAQDDLDELNHVNNVHYVQWVQDIAKEHWLKETTQEITNQYFWVMLSHFIEYKKEAKLHDVVLIKTFVIKSEGIYSIRMVEFYEKETETLLATSKTKWCFINSQSLRPTRIPQEVVAMFD